MAWLWMLVLWLGACLGDSDSLRSALEAIDRRQRDFADTDPALYYVDRFHPPAVVYTGRAEGDGQPEDIGYGYQKTLAPKTSGVFEAIPLPESDLGSHDPGVESHLPDEKSFENIILDYIEDNMGSRAGSDAQRYRYRNQNPESKRSVFRERDVNELPGSLQNLYSEGENSDQYFENGEHPHVLPSSFRERLSSKPSRNSHTHNAQALVRNFGGLDRDTEDFPDSDADPDEYLSVLNSVWEKYQHNNPEELDPEELSESDIDEILDYINQKEVKKRQPSSYDDMGYDFYNSPLAWVKRDRQILDSPKNPSNRIVHSHEDTLQDGWMDGPDGDREQDVAKLLMDEHRSSSDKRYTKRFWRGNAYEEHHHAKRYPIAKRSSNFYTSPAVLYHKASADRFNQRRKKNVKGHASDEVTDPKVARELNDIFSPPDKLKQASNKSESTTSNQSSVPANTSNNGKDTTVNQNDSKTTLEEVTPDHAHSSHSHSKRSGQKEETGIDSQHKPLEMSKKSIDWSNYFGIDRRRKKSSKSVNDQWLLDQYLKAYSISARAIKDSVDSKDEAPRFEIDKKNSDDMDAKLRAMEDMIVDQALKYTGAHEGTTNLNQVQEVKDRVIAQLAAAYSLEKMRKALSEFKSSIAAQKVSTPTHSTTNAPTDAPEQKDKRVAVKKEKAGLTSGVKVQKKDEEDNGISAIHSSGNSRIVSWNQEDSCPIMEDIAQRCREIANMAGDQSESMLPLCSVHQLCYLCGSEMGVPASGCDATFMSESINVCGDNPRCHYTARRTLVALHSVRGDPSPLGCAWQSHPCLTRFLKATMR